MTDNKTTERTSGESRSGLLPGYLHIDHDNPGRWTENAIDDVVNLAVAMRNDIEISSLLGGPNKTGQPITEEQQETVHRFQVDHFKNNGRKMPLYANHANRLLFDFFTNKFDDLNSNMAREYVSSCSNVYSALPNYEKSLL